MAKLRLNGEVFDFDFGHKPMSEAFAVEKVYGAPYGQWERDLAAGSMRAMAVMVWLVWRRDGRDVRFADIVSGDVETDLGPFLDDLAALGAEAQAEAEAQGEGEPDPTPAAAAATSPAAPTPAGTAAQGLGGSRTPPTPTS